jgi:phosphotransferase system HPr (HPr) family protein
MFGMIIALYLYSVLSLFLGGFKMYSQNVTVTNKTGLHARPAAVFVQTASKYKSNITLKKGDKTGSAKSILGVLSLGITKDSEITVIADGPDENEAVAKLIELINSKFGEE